MRLTLRTLLAWLDGVLPGAEQDELAAKVAASPIAPRLVDRIHDVMTRPGLVAPRPDGRGLADDPNTVAEFLDNVLPAERLETFERVCIESDMHLAEAADCHAMLAEMARDPAVVAPLDRRLQKRLLDQVARLAQQPASLQHRSQSRAEAHEEAAATVAALKEAVAASRTAGRGVAVGPAPAGRRASWAAWLSAGVAVLLLLGLVALLARSLFVGPTKRREVAVAPANGPAAPAASAEPQAVAAPLAADAEPPTVVPPVAGVDREAPPLPDAAAMPPSAAAPDKADSPAAPIAALPARVVPEPPLPNPPPAVPLPQMELDDDLPVAPPPEPPPAAPAVAPGAVAEGGALLHRVGEGDEAEWKPLVPGDQLAAVEEFAVPAHAFPRVIRGDVSIRLHPGTLAAIATDADGTPRLEVVFGRAVAWTEAAEAMLGVSAGGLSGVVALGPRQMVGVAVDLERQAATDPTVVPPGRAALLHATGGVRWRQTEIDGGPPGRPLAGIELEQALPPRTNLEWSSADPAAARIAPVGRSPEWMERQGATIRTDQAAGQELARRLAADGDIGQTLRAMAADRRVEDRMAAATTAALLGDYEPAVRLLCAESPDLMLREGQWSGFEAATVQQALARGANAATRLRETFAAVGPAGRGNELFLLARGLSPEELAGGGAAALVESLADSALVVRRYAFRNLLTAFSDDPAARVEYRPDRAAALNDKAVEWWRRKVAAAAPEAARDPIPAPAP